MIASFVAFFVDVFDGEGSKCLGIMVSFFILIYFLNVLFVFIMFFLNMLMILSAFTMSTSSTFSV